MKTIITLFLCFVSGAIQAQDWSYFPKDSLRCYAPDVKRALSGLSYRSYTADAGKLTVQLDSFSNYTYIKEGEHGGSYYYITGNSILGNKIVVDSIESKLIFLNDTDKTVLQDTFRLLNTNKIDNEWLAYKNDSVEIFARIIGLELQETPLGLDSVKEIRFVIKRDTLTDFLTMTCGKRFGVLQLLNFNTLRSSGKDISSIYHPVLKPYREMTEAEFYKIAPGTEFHDNPWFDKKDSCLFYRKYQYKYYLDNSNKVVTDKRIYQNKVTFSGNTWEESTSYIDSVALPYRQYKSSNKIANPIPSIHAKYDFFWDYYVRLSCTPEAYEISLSRNKGPSQTIEGDTLIKWSYYYEEVGVWDWHFVQGVGPTLITYYTTRNPSDEPHVNIEYYKTPQCENGEKIGELNRISINSSKNLTVYPNPVSEKLYVHFPKTNEWNTKVYSLEGKIYDLELREGYLDVSELENGMYIIQLYNQSDIYRKKFMVEH